MKGSLLVRHVASRLVLMTRMSSSYRHAQPPRRPISGWRPKRAVPVSWPKFFQSFFQSQPPKKTTISTHSATHIGQDESVVVQDPDSFLVTTGLVGCFSVGGVIHSSDQQASFLTHRSPMDVSLLFDDIEKSMTQILSPLDPQTARGSLIFFRICPKVSGSTQLPKYEVPGREGLGSYEELVDVVVATLKGQYPNLDIRVVEYGHGVYGVREQGCTERVSLSTQQGRVFWTTSIGEEEFELNT